MKFSNQQDIDVPIAYVYRRVTNFAAYERQALRQGAHVVRVDGDVRLALGRPGMWRLRFATKIASLGRK